MQFLAFCRRFHTLFRLGVSAGGKAGLGSFGDPGLERHRRTGWADAKRARRFNNRASWWPAAEHYWRTISGQQEWTKRAVDRAPSTLYRRTLSILAPRRPGLISSGRLP